MPKLMGQTSFRCIAHRIPGEVSDEFVDDDDRVIDPAVETDIRFDFKILHTIFNCIRNRTQSCIQILHANYTGLWDTRILRWDTSP